MPLINLVPPSRNESLESYLAHLGRVNYYEEKNWFNALIQLPRETHVNFLYSGVHLQRLSKLVTLSVPTLYTMTLHRFVPNFYAPGSLLQLPVISREGEGLQWEEKGKIIFIKGTGDKVCPQCFQENGAFLLPWLLRPVTTCPIHHILLLDSCSTCGHKFRLDKGVCPQCGQLVAEMEANSIQNDEVAVKLTQLVWAALGCSDTPFPGLEEFPFTRLSPPLFFQLLWKLGSLLLEYDPDHPRLQVINLQQQPGDRRNTIRQLDNGDYHQVMTAVCELLMNWPSNWHSALSRILQSEETRRVATHTDPEKVWKRRSFPYTLRKALGGVADWGWLWDSLIEFTKSCTSGVAGIHYWQPYQELTWGEVNDNISALQSDFRGNNTVYPNNNALLSLTHAANHLGISRNAVLEFTKFGMISSELRALPRSRPKWLFRREHLDAAVDKIFEGLPLVSPPVQPEQPIIFLTSAIHSVNYAGIKLIDLIDAISRGDLPAHRAPNIPGLKAVWFDEKTLSLFRLGWLHPSGVVRESIYRVEKILNCSKKTLKHLAEAGLLLPAWGYPHDSQKYWYYHQHDIEAFRERFITSEVAASIIGCRPRSVLDWVKQGKLEAVSGPGIDNAPHYRFDKQKVIQWREERLTSIETRALLEIKPRTMEDWVAKGKLKPLENMGRQPYWFAKSDILRIVEGRKVVV